METVTIKAEEYQKIVKANHKMTHALRQIKPLIDGVDCRYTKGDLAILDSLNIISEALNVSHRSIKQIR